MNKDKILIISPKFHPLEDGLGQYTKYFFLELRKHFDVSVITSSEHQISVEENDFKKVHPIMKGWKIPKLFKLGEKIREIDPDILLFQYVPFMYEVKGGINFSIAFYILYLRLFTNKKIHIMFHELNYPFELNLKALAMFLSHHIMYIIISLSAHKVFCSTSYFKRRISKVFLGLKKSIYHLPVGSNIKMSTVGIESLKDFKKEYVRDDEVLLGCFGSFHPAKNYPLILNAIVELNRKSNNKIKILFIGATKEDILNHVDLNIREELSDIVYGSGFLPNDLVAKYLSILDGFLAYFSDGVSTRRGSLIAALQQGIPILTTKGVNIDDIFEKNDFIKLLNNSQNQFKKELEIELKAGWPLNIKKNFEIKSFYSDNFSWESIVQSYKKSLDN